MSEFPRIILGVSSTQIYKNTDDNNLNFYNNNLNVISLDSSGNVGIGDTTPNYKLDVNGTGRFTSDLTVDANLIVHGTTVTMNTETMTIEDPLISLAANNSADLIDSGFYSQYNDGTTKYTGLFRDSSDSGEYKLFKSLEVEPTTTVNTSGTGYSLADLECANINLTGDLSINGQVQSFGDSNIWSEASSTATYDGSVILNGTGSCVFQTKCNDTVGFQLTQINGVTDLYFSAFDTTTNYLIMNATSLTLGNDIDFFTMMNGKMTIQDLQVQEGTIHLTNSSTGALSTDGTHLSLSGKNFNLNNKEASATLFSTNDTERMRIDSSGKVGIGTDNPAKALHVVSSQNEILRLDNTSGGESYIGYFNTETVSTPSLTIGLNSTESCLINMKDEKAMIFKTYNTERMRIKSDGNIGIGTQYASEKLHIYDDANDSIQLKIENAYASSRAGVSLVNDGGTFNIQAHSGTAILENLGTGGTYFYQKGTGDGYHFKTTNSNTERLTIDTDGNVGIGTSTPQQLLELYGTTPRMVINSADQADSSIDFFNRDGNNYMNWPDRTILGQIRFMGEEGVSGDSGDNYDIAKVFCSIQGRIHTDNGGSNGGWLQGGFGFYTNDGDGNLAGTTGNNLTEKITIDYRGWMGIGDTTPDAQLDVVGSIAYTGSLTGPSDGRFKDNQIIVDYDECYNKVKQLDLKNYNWNEEIMSKLKIEVRNQNGFVAQDVEVLMPDAIKQRRRMGIEDFRVVDYNKINMYLFGAFKKSQENIGNLEEINIETSLKIKNLEEINTESLLKFQNLEETNVETSLKIQNLESIKLDSRKNTMFINNIINNKNKNKVFNECTFSQINGIIKPINIIDDMAYIQYKDNNNNVKQHTAEITPYYYGVGAESLKTYFNIYDKDRNRFLPTIYKRGKLINDEIELYNHQLKVNDVILVKFTIKGIKYEEEILVTEIIDTTHLKIDNTKLQQYFEFINNRNIFIYGTRQKDVSILNQKFLYSLSSLALSGIKELNNKVIKNDENTLELINIEKTENTKQNVQIQSNTENVNNIAGKFNTLVQEHTIVKNIVQKSGETINKLLVENNNLKNIINTLNNDKELNKKNIILLNTNFNKQNNINQNNLTLLNEHIKKQQILINQLIEKMNNPVV
jgi:hypothetical protein